MSGTGIIDKGQPFKLRVQHIPAIIMLIGVTAGFYYPFHHIHINEVRHQGIAMALPILGISYLAIVIPLFMYISYIEDYRGLNPLNPEHFMKIVRKSYTAMSKNNGKVGVKDL